MKKTPSAARVTTIERLLYVASTALVLGVAALVVGLDLMGPDDPHPRLEATVDGAPWNEGRALAVPWVLENLSSWDVEQVQVRVRVGESEPVEQEVDYLARGATRRGVALVGGGEGVPTVRVVAYKLP